jgi:hypothetical protein
MDEDRSELLVRHDESKSQNRSLVVLTPRTIDHDDYDEGDDQERPLTHRWHVEPHDEKIAKRAHYVAA